MSRYASAQARMVAHQLRDIRDTGVLAAMGSVPRHEFLPEILRHRAYEDGALPIARGQTISQPWIVARMTELIGVKEGDRVLEIGTGSGYQTAILSPLCKSIVSIERHGELAKEARTRLESMGLRNITVLAGDGTMGRSEFAPYDAIIVTAGAPEVPRPLRTQLRVGGRMVLPVGAEDVQTLVRVTRRGEDDYDEERFEACRFVPLLGRFGWKE